MSAERRPVRATSAFFDDLETQLAPEQPIDRVLAFVTLGVESVVARAATTRPALLAQEQGRGGERRTTPMAIERQRAAIQMAMDDGYLRTDLRADLLAAQAYEGFHRAALMWAKGDLEPERFRSKALYSACICLLAVATDVSRVELLRTTQDLETKLDRDDTRVPRHMEEAR